MTSKLSPREREIIDLVAGGRTSKEIATDLGISQSTVDWHLGKAFGKLGASSRAEAVALSLRADGDGAVPHPDDSAAPRRSRLGARFVAPALAIALMGALVGGATVLLLGDRLDPLRSGSPSSAPTPTARP